MNAGRAQALDQRSHTEATPVFEVAGFQVPIFEVPSFHPEAPGGNYSSNGLRTKKQRVEVKRVDLAVVPVSAGVNPLKGGPLRRGGVRLCAFG